MKKFLLSLFVIFLAYITAYYTSGASEKQELFEFGKSPMLYKMKCAITGESDTTDAHELYSRAGYYMDIKEFGLAINDYKSVIRLNPDLVYVRIDLAMAYLAINDTAMAISCYQQHISESDFPEAAYIELGRLYQNLSLTDSTLYYYKKTIDNDPENYQVYFYLSEYYFDIKDYNAALENINTAIKHSQYDLDYINQRRRIYLKLGKIDLAKADYSYISSNDSYYFEDYKTKAKEAKEEGNLQDAIKYYTLAIELDGSDEDLFKERAWVYHAVKSYDLALVDFKKTVEISPDYYNYFNVAYTLDFLDSIEESIEYYNKSIELKDDDYLSYNNRGYEYYRLEKYNKAIRDYTTSIKLKNDYYLSYNNRGLTYFRQKNYKKAIEDYNKAKDLTENNASIIYNIALAYDKMKNRAKTIEYFNEYLDVALNSDSINTDYAKKRIKKLSK